MGPIVVVYTKSLRVSENATVQIYFRQDFRPPNTEGCQIFPPGFTTLRGSPHKNTKLPKAPTYPSPYSVLHCEESVTRRMSRATQRPLNGCYNCGDTWHPRGRDLSNRCPNCGSRDTYICPYDWGWIKMIGIGLGVLFLLGLCAPEKDTEVPQESQQKISQTLSVKNSEDR